MWEGKGEAKCATEFWWESLLATTWRITIKILGKYMKMVVA
jgi:hypothetical protein